MSHEHKEEYKSSTENDHSSLDQFNKELVNAGFTNEHLNIVKLQIYDCNVKECIQYYKHDKFCAEYLVHYDCCNQSCKLQHKLRLFDLIFTPPSAHNHHLAKVLCEYLLDSLPTSDKNNKLKSEIYRFYGDLLCVTQDKQIQNMNKSKQSYINAIKMNPNNDFAHNNYAKLLLDEKLKDYKTAEIHYRKAMELDAQNVISCFNYAWFLLNKLNKYEKSLELFEKCIKMNKNYVNACYGCGLTLFKLNKHKEALEKLQNVLVMLEKSKNNSALFSVVDKSNVEKLIKQLHDK